MIKYINLNIEISFVDLYTEKGRNKLKCQKLNALMHVAGNYVNQIHSTSVNNLILELDMGSE